MLHGVRADQTASTSQPSLAVHGHAAFLLLGNSDEFLDDRVWRYAAIREEEVRVGHAFAQEAFTVLSLRVEPDHVRHVIGVELRDIMFRGEAAAILGVLVGRGKRYTFAWNNPVQIALLHFFLLLVLSHVKIRLIEPPQFQCVF